jgi:hypothetical protein
MIEKWTEAEIQRWVAQAQDDEFMVDCIGGSEIIQQLLAELAKSNRLIISAESQLVACEKELALAKKEAGEYLQEVNTMHRCNDLNGMVHEAVMHVIRGEKVSDFEESFADVREAIDLVAKYGVE